MSELERALRAELVRINKLYQDIVEIEKDQYLPGSNPDLWTHKDGKFVLMPLNEARTRLLCGIALERNTGELRRTR